MSYSVKEIFYTLQGEGRHSGRPAVFCRFTGCNLWSGHERDRETAQCSFCDTDFVGTDGEGGGRFESARILADEIASKWPSGKLQDSIPFVVCTGGEPLLQLDSSLVDALHGAGFEIAIETNGTLLPPLNVDWVCVSPKAHTRLVLKRGGELKLVFPQKGAEPELYADMAFENFYLQPMDNPSRKTNTELALQYCLTHPRWRLSLQTHKMLGIP